MIPQEIAIKIQPAVVINTSIRFVLMAARPSCKPPEASIASGPVRFLQKI